MADHGPASRPCGSCPYRKDTPSGVWSAAEYDKLPAFDLQPMHLQPPMAFYCHRNDGRLCAGWVGCHNMEESLGLRIAASVGMLDREDVEDARNYVSPVPLWESGTAAAEHGKREVEHPSEEAVAVVDKLKRRVKGLEYG